MKHQMTTQARRIISNAFARFYYVSSTRGFEKWKEYVRKCLEDSCHYIGFSY